MKYTIHEDPKLTAGISYENAPVFADGDIVELITVEGSSHLFTVSNTEEYGANCTHCEVSKDTSTSCLKYWFQCVGTHLKQLDKIMEGL